jgi:hypothetical protein
MRQQELDGPLQGSSTCMMRYTLAASNTATLNRQLPSAIGCGEKLRVVPVLLDRVELVKMARAEPYTVEGGGHWLQPSSICSSSHSPTIVGKSRSKHSDADAFSVMIVGLALPNHASHLCWLDIAHGRPGEGIAVIGCHVLLACIQDSCPSCSHFDVISSSSFVQDGCQTFRHTGSY